MCIKGLKRNILNNNPASFNFNSLLERGRNQILTMSLFSVTVTSWILILLQKNSGSFQAGSLSLVLVFQLKQNRRGSKVSNMISGYKRFKRIFIQTGEGTLPYVVVVEEIRVESCLDKTGHTSWKMQIRITLALRKNKWLKCN